MKIKITNKMGFTRIISCIKKQCNKKECAFLKQGKTRLVVLFVLLSTILPVTVFYCWIRELDYESDKSRTCVVDPSYRVPCGLHNISCIRTSCCYDSELNQCYHAIPAAYNYKKSEKLHYVPTLTTTPLFTKPLEKLMLTVTDIDVNSTSIILHDTSVHYEANEVLEKHYVIKQDESTLGVEVFRKSNSQLLLTTFRGPLIATDGYWEWTFQLTSDKLIGLGEIKFNGNETLTKVIYKNENDHNTLPIFMAYSNGSFHGAVVDHQGPLEVTVLPSKLVILKSLAGSKIALNLCVGGSDPNDVVNQLKLYKPAPIPPYWVLGAHICRDGLTTMELAEEEYKEFIETEKDIFYASDCIHENLYFMFDQTTEMKEKLQKHIKDLQVKSHFMFSITPHLQRGTLYDDAVNSNLLYFHSNNSILIGHYLGQDVAYPDFTHNSIVTWMKNLSATFPANNIDGFVLRNNWPLNENYQFINNEQFKYLTKDLYKSLNKTIPLDGYSKSKTPPLKHILTHNQYGAAQATAFKNNLKHEFLMTASYDYNIPDAALIQNVNITWPSFKNAITTTLYHSIFGSNLISIPICGSTEHYVKDFHEDLCMRWYILSATFPLFRISSEKPRRDPSSLSKYARNVAISAIQKRLLLSLYYHTSLKSDNMLVKPMFYRFHSDNIVWDLDEQYMLGNSLLVAHPVLPKTSKLKVYLPPSAGVWYEFWGGRKYAARGWLTVDFVDSDWVMFIQQGHIVPLRSAVESAMVGSYSPEDTYTFAVALHCTETTECRSDGQLTLSSESLKLSANYKAIVISNVNNTKQDIGCQLQQPIWPCLINRVIIYGINDDNATYPNFKPIDLCKVTEDTITIEYMKKL